jgi:nucleotide-binding universal stress UspA family protein
MRTDGPVVICLDGSPRSERTLAWGLHEAERLGAPVVLARAWQEPDEFAMRGWFPTLPPSDLDGEARDYLDAVRLREAARRPQLHVTTSLRHGPVVPELRALSRDARLLVVGPGPRRRPGHVALHLAAHAQCPVAVVRDDGETTRGAASGLARPVVVGVDGSPCSLEAARRAAQAAVARGARLRVVHARPTVAAPYGTGAVPSVADDADPAHAATRTLAESLRADHPGLEVETVLVDDDPAHAVIDAAEHAQLVVLGSRGLGAFRGMLLGSVSHEVVRDAPCSVLVLHDSGQDAGHDAD